MEDFAAAFIRLEGGIILDFRIAWAMHVDTPGDTIIMGKKAALRIPSTDCWNGSVGGEMTLYTDVAGAQTETKIPIIPTKGDVFSGLFYKKIRSFLDAIKEGKPAPVPVQPDSVQPGHHRRHRQVRRGGPRNQDRDPRKSDYYPFCAGAFMEKPRRFWQRKRIDSGAVIFYN